MRVIWGKTPALRATRLSRSQDNPDDTVLSLSVLPMSGSLLSRHGSWGRGEMAETRGRGVSATWGSQKRDEEGWGILLLLPPQTGVKSQVSPLLCELGRAVTSKLACADQMS